MNERIQARTEINRELQMRGYVYPKLVANGKLTQGEADRRMNALRCALHYLDSLADDSAMHTPSNSGE